MSFNRRGGMSNQNSIGNIGRRRPQISNNFVPGGQLTPQKGGIQPSFNNKPTPQINKPQQSQQNAPLRPPNQPVQQILQKPPAPTQPTPPTPAPQLPAQVKPEVVAPMDDSTNSENGDVKPEGGKKSWMLRKIPKRERIRKRNLRLGKLLQPKNALMVLNEIVPNNSFEVVDFQNHEGASYKATIVIDGQEHVGYGKNKTCAKNNAAEVALKYFVKNKKMLTNENNVEKMDTTDGDGEAPEAQSESTQEASSLPWQQVASFALFKLFDSWGESPIVAKEENPLKELKPAKKLPENAETLNPLMVVNQMFPNAQFEDLPRTGNQPNLVFNTRCTIDGQIFMGSGPTKKLSKRNASYAICKSLLGIKYTNLSETEAQ